MAVLAGVAVPLALVVGTGPASSVQPHAVGTPTVEATTTVEAATVVERAAGNPLAGRKWGVYKGRGDQAWEPYERSTGEERELLAKIALRPKAKWFGNWIPTRDIGKKVRDYIQNSTGGDPDVLVQMTVFRMKPWEHDACKSLPTAEQTRSYKEWTDAFAAAIGNAHVALILQPDGPFALCAPGGSLAPSKLIRYSTEKFGALPNTSVYIDAGAADWLRDDPARAAKILVPAGVEGVRGFALNSTHYVSTGREIRFGTSVVNELARRGIPGKHFVINTSSNGKPFAGYTYKGPNFDNAWVCQSKSDRRCVTLGIPPTLDVTNTKWGLGERNRARAAKHVDAYLWFGRPWLYMQADPFLKDRALQLVRTTPY
jgi:cellulase/cellobiase CelA1